MIIKPKVGFDNIKFGMFRKDVINILGEPNNVFVDNTDENELRLEWNHLKLRLCFQKDENDRLTYFSSKNVELRFKNQKIIGENIEKATKEIFATIISDWEIEDFQFFKTYFNEDFWLTLRTDFNEIDEFEMGAPFKNENEYNWPE